jgi:uncharacterized protein YfcZ (UPF0381/DUF406 family)
VLAEIANARRYTELPNPTDLFLSCETLVSALATLIGPLMDLETAYRQEIVLSLDAGDSHAKAEAKAKAGQSYAEWCKLQMVHDLAEHQVNLVKKFKDELQAEKPILRQRKIRAHKDSCAIV